jgi:hypothetical protein
MLGSDGRDNRSEMLTRTIPCKVRRGEADQSIRRNDTPGLAPQGERGAIGIVA